MFVVDSCCCLPGVQVELDQLQRIPVVGSCEFMSRSFEYFSRSFAIVLCDFLLAIRDVTPNAGPLHK